MAPPARRSAVTAPHREDSGFLLLRLLRSAVLVLRGSLHRQGWPDRTYQYLFNECIYLINRLEKY